MEQATGRKSMNPATAQRYLAGEEIAVVTGLGGTLTLRYRL